MTVLQKIRALAEAEARRKIYDAVKHCKAEYNLRTADDEICVARGDLLTEEVLSRVTNINDFEHLQTGDMFVQERMYEAIDEYNEVASYVDFTNLRARLMNIAKDHDPGISHITIHRKRVKC